MNEEYKKLEKHLDSVRLPNKEKMKNIFGIYSGCLKEFPSANTYALLAVFAYGQIEGIRMERQRRKTKKAGIKHERKKNQVE